MAEIIFVVLIAALWLYVMTYEPRS